MTITYRKFDGKSHLSTLLPLWEKVGAEGARMRGVSTAFTEERR
jgi:hypothetical protein